MPELEIFNSGREFGCTCPPKLRLNVYHSCTHGCIYCYGQVFWRDKTPKKSPGNLITTSRFSEEYRGNAAFKSLENDMKRLKNKNMVLPICLSPICDPYLPQENKNNYTRHVLELALKYYFPVLIMTKSDLVTRDKDLLENLNSVVALTITTADKEKAKRIEPFAPEPEKRLKAVKYLSDTISTSVRIDPILPGFTDSEEELEKLVEKSEKAGAKHITSSVLKISAKCFNRITSALPEFADYYKKIYINYQTPYFHAPLELRKEIIGRIKKITEEHGLTFGSCREPIGIESSSTCDAQNYLKMIAKKSKMKSLNNFA